MNRAPAAFVVVCLLAAAAPPIEAGPDDGGRAFEVRYVASPFEGGGSSDPDSGLAVGGIEFDLLETESRLLVTIADDVFDRTEVTAVFFFGDAPIRHTITFCRQHGMDVPDGATHVRLQIEQLVGFAPDDSTCGSGHGASTGVLSVQVA